MAFVREFVKHKSNRELKTINDVSLLTVEKDQLPVIKRVCDFNLKGSKCFGRLN